MNQTMNSQTDVEVEAHRDFPPDAADHDPDDPRERELEADDGTPEEAGYGYGV